MNITYFKQSGEYLQTHIHPTSTATPYQEALTYVLEQIRRGKHPGLKHPQPDILFAVILNWPSEPFLYVPPSPVDGGVTFLPSNFT